VGADTKKLSGKEEKFGVGQGIEANTVQVTQRFV
jgi:hypothetical protein